MRALGAGAGEAAGSAARRWRRRQAGESGGARGSSVVRGRAGTATSAVRQAWLPRGKVRSQEGLLPRTARDLISNFCSVGSCRWKGENWSSRACSVVLLLWREAWLGRRKLVSEGEWLQWAALWPMPGRWSGAAFACVWAAAPVTHGPPVSARLCTGTKGAVARR